eukprot:UN07450
MDPNHRQSVTELWREYDPTTAKRIPVESLRLIFLGLGKDISDKDLNACTKGGATCSLDMLLEFLAMMPKATANSEDIQNSAIVLSQYTGGQLKTSELRLLLCTQGERLDNTEAACLVTDADNGAGYVDVQRFSHIITKAD